LADERMYACKEQRYTSSWQFLTRNNLQPKASLKAS
jgi:hypothetical protein